MRITYRDLTALATGLSAAALVTDIGTRGPGWIVYDAISLAVAAGAWLRLASRTRSPGFAASCMVPGCGWESGRYLSAQDAISAARAHSTLADHPREDA